MAGVDGRVALVTGAGSADGIGFAIARALKAAGARVAITATGPRIEARRTELGEAGTFAAAADLTDPGAPTALVAAVEEALGPIGILVNNAGMIRQGEAPPEGELHGLSDTDWDAALAMNLTSAFRMTRAVLPGMRARGYGRIVFIGSATGPVAAIAGQGAYAAAKAGISGLARAAALENAGAGITVNCVAPGWIATASSTEVERSAGRHTPVGRPGRPAEVAHVALCLAAEEASYITGQTIVVDGGNLIEETRVVAA
jgi:3-oxoacyl-[acyl-carrier protein] reductase